MMTKDEIKAMTKEVESASGIYWRDESGRRFTPFYDVIYIGGLEDELGRPYSTDIWMEYRDEERGDIYDDVLIAGEEGETVLNLARYKGQLLGAKKAYEMLLDVIRSGHYTGDAPVVTVDVTSLRTQNN